MTVRSAVNESQMESGHRLIRVKRRRDDDQVEHLVVEEQQEREAALEEARRKRALIDSQDGSGCGVVSSDMPKDLGEKLEKESINAKATKKEAIDTSRGVPIPIPGQLPPRQTSSLHKSVGQRKETEVVFTKRVYRLVETVSTTALTSQVDSIQMQDFLKSLVAKRSAEKSAAVSSSSPATTQAREDQKKSDRRNMALKTSKTQRYKVVNSNRGILERRPDPESNDHEILSPSLFQVYDVVKEDVELLRAEERLSSMTKFDPDEILCNYMPMMMERMNVRDDANEYVYDIYVREDVAVGEGEDDMHVDLRLMNLVYDNEDSENSDIIMTDDEDSNAEEHYANDYPDEDEDEEEEEGYGNANEDEDDDEEGEDDGHLSGGISRKSRMLMKYYGDGSDHDGDEDEMLDYDGYDEFAVPGRREYGDDDYEFGVVSSGSDGDNEGYDE